MSEEAKLGYKQTDIGVIPEDWEVRRLGDVARVIGGGAFKSQDSQQVGVRWLKIANVGINEILWHDTSFLPEEFALIHNSFLLRQDDCILALTRPILSGALKIARVRKGDAPALLNQRVGKIESVNNNDLGFLYFVFQKESTVSAMQQSMAGTDPPNLSTRCINNISCMIPANISEQEAIAEALSDADALIESLEQLIAKKRNIKQGAMQEILRPKDGWAEKRIGDLLTITHGKSQLGIADRNGIYPILGTGGQMGTTNHILYDKPSVLIGRKGTIDRPRYMDQPFWTVDTLFYSMIHEPNNAKYLFYQFCLIDWKQYNEASGVPSLNARTIEKIEIKVPSSSEQNRIAEVLSDMDAEIATLETKLAKTRQLKQGMMHNLLTGRIRLI